MSNVKFLWYICHCLATTTLHPFSLIQSSVDEPQLQPNKSTVDEPQLQLIKSSVDDPQSQSIKSSVDDPQSQSIRSSVDAPQVQSIKTSADEPQLQFIQPTVDELQLQFNAYEQRQEQVEHILRHWDRAQGLLLVPLLSEENQPVSQDAREVSLLALSLYFFA